MKQRNSKMYWLVFMGVALALATIICCIWLPYRHKAKAPQSNQNSNEETSNNNLNSQINSDKPSSEDYYQKGLTEFANKDYSLATTFFTEAIKINPQNIDAYIKKSEALYNQNDKKGSVDIIKEGLVINPNNSQLKSRLDTLQIDPRSEDYSL